MSLWAWACRAYESPGVADLCLELQDAHGLSVGYLLWAAWTGASDPQALAPGAALARTWEAEVLQPLRGVRRRLKMEVALIPDGARQGFRDEVKGIELSAERLLLEALEPLAGRGAAGRLEALQAACLAWSVPPPAALPQLAKSLEPVAD